MTVNVLHAITGLGLGGAERMLLKLVSRMDPHIFTNEIVSLTGIDTLAENFRAAGIPVRILGMRPGVPDPRGVVRLARWIGRSRPHIVQTWMYHSDLIGGMAARLAGNVPVIWNIRNGTLQPGSSSRRTILTARACAGFSRLLPQRIVCCAEAARQIHLGLGYAGGKMVVIPNGFDLSLFRPDPAARFEVRRELSIPANTPLIGLVARFDPQKDYHGFVRAAAILAARRRNARFLLCGHNADWNNSLLSEWIRAAGLGNAVHLLGVRNDTPRLNASFDIACSSSVYGEGFSNAVGEAMSCGIPCVVTDVGDSARIVGDTGLVIRPGDSQGLAAAWEKLLDIGPQGRQRLGEAARQRIAEHFSLEKVVEQYQSLYQDVASVAKTQVPNGGGVVLKRGGKI